MGTGRAMRTGTSGSCHSAAKGRNTGAHTRNGQGIEQLSSLSSFAPSNVGTPAPQQASRASLAVLVVLAGAFVAFMAGVALPAYIGASQSTADVLSLAWLTLAGIGLPVGMGVAVRHMGARSQPSARAAAAAQAGSSKSVADPTPADAAADHDELTGLLRYAQFEDELAKQADLAYETGFPVALAILDVDELRRTNGELGQQAGDRVLATIGRLIRERTRSDDLGFRVGADEFAIIMPRCSAGRAQSVVRRLLLGALDMCDGSRDWYETSFSAGISSYPELTSGSARLRRDAEAALKWAKKHGRTDVQLFDQFRDLSEEERRSDEQGADLADDDFTSDGQGATPIQLRFLGTTDESDADPEWVDPRLVTIGLAEPPR